MSIIQMVQALIVALEARDWTAAFSLLLRILQAISGTAVPTPVASLSQQEQRHLPSQAGPNAKFAAANCCSLQELIDFLKAEIAKIQAVVGADAAAVLAWGKDIEVQLVALIHKMLGF